jgi:uncharacterized protein
MPLTEKGRKILAAMQEKYGEEKGKKVFYASKNAGKISGVDSDFEDIMPIIETLDARRKTIVRGKRGNILQTREEEEEDGIINTDAWSEEARKAALEARRKKASPWSGEGNKAVKALRKARAAGPEALERYRARHAQRIKKSTIASSRRRKAEWAGKRLKTSGPGGKTKVGAGFPKDSVTVEIIDTIQPSSIHATVYDAVELDAAAQIDLTTDGYLKAMPRIARTGIQLYKGKECGMDGMEVVRVYRPEATVFANDAVKTYSGLPITIEHPGHLVDASNWKEHAVGETGEDILRDGNSIRVPMMLRDAAAIQAVREGKNQLSVGYTCDIEWGAGVSPDGEKYDAVQHNIRANHLAVVSKARGGSTLTIGDTTMDQKTLLVDGISCQMSDVSASVVQRAIKRLQDSYEVLETESEEQATKVTELAAEVEKKDAAIKVKDAEIADLKKQLDAAKDPKSLRDSTSKLLAVIDKAQKVTGKTIKMDNVNDAAAIMREVVNGKLGDTAKGWSDEKIEAAFDTITVSTPSQTIKDAVSVFGGTHQDGGHRPGNNYTPDFAGQTKAYEDSVKDLENAWKTKQQ